MTNTTSRSSARRRTVLTVAAAVAVVAGGIGIGSTASARPATTPPPAPSGPSCAEVPTEGEGSVTGMADDPVATAASNNPLLSTLVTAVDAAGLVDTLNGEGPFTVFAPINSAFEKIPAPTLEAVLADPQGLLTDILSLHVVAGQRLTSSDLAETTTIETLAGPITAALGEDGVTVTLDAGGGPATIVCADVPTANATVFLIDTVLTPAAAAPSGPACAAVPTEGEGSVEGMSDDPAATAASNNPELSTLVAAVQAAGLVDTLNGEGPFTIFAPANSAFAAIPQEQLDAVLADPEGLLTEILTLHVVAGSRLSSLYLAGAGQVESLNGPLTVALDGETLTVDGGGGAANVVCADVQTSNATVHIIDGVLLPGAAAPTDSAPAGTDTMGTEPMTTESMTTDG